MSRKTCTRLLVTVLVCLCIMNASAETTFSSIDLGPDSELLFTASTDDSSLCSYQSLYLATLTSAGDQAALVSPEILTCFPQQLNSFRNGHLLEIRNNAGTALYDADSHMLTWTEGSNLSYQTKFQTSAILEPAAVSPDGNWKCFFEKKSAVTADVWLMNTSDGRKIRLAENAEYRFDRIPVLWSPDSSVLIYEKEGILYFLKTTDAFSSASLTEEFRVIGKGNINNVAWADSRTIVYVNYDIVYAIAVNELQTRALYSDFLGMDRIAGRLPVPFDSEKDTFWANSDVTALVVVQNNRTLWYLELKGTDFNFVSTILSYPLMHLNGAAVSCHVFWTTPSGGVQYPVVWIEIFRSGERESYVYQLSRQNDGSCTFTPRAMPVSVSDPKLSPDGSKLAFKSEMNLLVYDLDSWQQTDVLSGERIISYIWFANDRLYTGSDATVREWNISEDRSTVLLLSSVDRAAWNVKGDTILGINRAGTFAYDRSRKIWKNASAGDERGKSVQNKKWRVFIGDSKSGLFTNGIYVRTLSGLTETRPLITAYTVPEDSLPRVSLVFDALDNADGLTKILDTLEKNNLKATFFINGEFIRRFPSSVQEIVKAGHQCASMFFTTGNLTSMTFVADESYIRRGLARNEDEFYTLTGEELSLYWHAPYYAVNDSICNYGKKAGYSYVESICVPKDTSTIEQYVHETKDYFSTRQIIEEYTGSLHAGCVIPVATGVASGTRTDYLYDRLDVLIEAIQEAGYKIVPVSEL